MILDELITDRTEADVDRARELAAKSYDAMSEAERAEWASDPKGAYNASDFHRAGGAAGLVPDPLLSYLQDLEDCLATLSVAPDSIFRLPYEAADVDVSPRTDWIDDSYPTKEEAEAYLRDIRTLRGLMTMPEVLAELPESMIYLDYYGANAIEATLLAVRDTAEALLAQCKANADRSARSAWQCGEINCGEV